MNRWDGINGMLALVVAGLVTLLALPIGEVPRASLLEMEPGAIDEIRLERRDRLVLRLARDGDHWRMTYPEPALADPARVAQLLAVAGAPVVHRVSPTPGTDYGLDPGTLVLQFGQRRIAFGDRDPTMRYRYVRVDGEIRVVDDTYYQLAGLPAGHYRAK